MSRVRWVWRGALCALLLVGLASPAGAQGGRTGTAVGKVTDDKGEPAVGAAVVLHSLETPQECKVKTDKKGEYSCIGLRPGRYELSVRYKNFIGKMEVDIKGGEAGDPISLHFANRFDLKMGEAAAEEQAQREEEFEKIKSGFERAVTLNRSGKFEEALAELQPILEARPNQWSVHWQIAVAYRGLNRDQEAEASTKKAIELNPTNADLHNELGRLYMKMKRVDEARAQFETAAQLSPENATAYWFNLAVSFLNAGDHQSALEPLRKVIELDPGHANAHYYLGLCLYSTAESKVEGGEVKLILPPGTREEFETYLALAPAGPLAEQAKAFLEAIDATVPAAVRARKKK